MKILQMLFYLPFKKILYCIRQWDEPHYFLAYYTFCICRLQSSSFYVYIKWSFSWIILSYACNKSFPFVKKWSLGATYKKHFIFYFFSNLMIQNLWHHIWWFPYTHRGNIPLKVFTLQAKKIFKFEITNLNPSWKLRG